MRSYRHIGAETPLLGSTLDERFREIVTASPDATAVVSRQQGVRLSYRNLDEHVQQWARALMAAGFEAGDRVGIWSTNNIEWVILQLATARAGIILVNINPAYRTTELEYALDRAEVQGLFLIPEFKSSHYLEIIRDVAPGRHALRKVVVFDPDNNGVSDAAPFQDLTQFLDGAQSISAADVEERATQLDADDDINIQFTSGTTGSPKPVVLTHHNIVNNALGAARILGLGPGEALAVPVPFYHCFGMVLSTLVCVLSGATLVIPAEHFDAAETLEAVEVERCSALHGVPTMFVAMLEELRRQHRDTRTLRTGIMAGAPCPPELVRAVQNELGCSEILIGYGQTEASPLTHLTRPSDSLERRTQTVGTNLPHQEVKVIDPQSGRVVPTGTPGEVCFRGYHVMRGYFGDAEATARTIDENRWLHSGDLGIMDTDGYVRITGRLKDMIIRGGENIYPAEIEAFFYRHPKVAEMAVFGVPDERWGEEVAAWVRPRAGQELDPDELRTWARDQIAHYKIPRHIWIVDELPMTVTGKIQKFRMREIAARALQEQGSSKGEHHGRKQQEDSGHSPL